MDNGAVRTLLARVLSAVPEEEMAHITEDLEGVASFRDFLTEEEARDTVRGFVSQDGSQGAHWDDPAMMEQAVTRLGIPVSSQGEYNFWAFFATMNMIWSDEWGVLKDFIPTEDEVEVCASLARARLLDRDGTYSVRWYFGIDE